MPCPDLLVAQVALGVPRIQRQRTATQPLVKFDFNDDERQEPKDLEGIFGTMTQERAELSDALLYTFEI